MGKCTNACGYRYYPIHERYCGSTEYIGRDNNTLLLLNYVSFLFSNPLKLIRLGGRAGVISSGNLGPTGARTASIITQQPCL